MEEVLDLQDITLGYCGLTQRSGAHMLEGCIAALWLHKHQSNLVMTLKGTPTRTFTLKFPEEWKTTQLANSWKNKTVATEKGAECIGILLALKLTEFEVVEQAVSYTGVDYWIGNSADGILYQKKARLELSGIFEGDDADIDYRFSKKCKQTDQSDESLLPAFIAITEFSKPASKFGQK